MKICVLGAGGRTGVEVVNAAGRLGFNVVAFVYSDRARRDFPMDTVVKKGNVMEYDSLLEAVRGVDAVISVIGHVKGSDPFMQTKGMVNLVKAMEAASIKRVLSLTGTGARVMGDEPSILDKALNCIVAKVDPERIKDGVEHIEVLRKSGLDWTVVRVLKLGKNRKEIKKYRLTDGGPAEPLTSRKKAAKVLVELVGQEEYFGKFPIISG
jgi:putative NADH-flavin reductase